MTNLYCPFHPFLRPLPYSRRDLSRTQTWSRLPILPRETPLEDLSHGPLSLAFLLLPADSNFHSISTQLVEWFWVQFAATTLLWPVEFSLPGNPSFHIPPQSLAPPTGVLINIWMIASPWASSICQAEPVCYSLNLKCPLKAHVL